MAENKTVLTPVAPVPGGFLKLGDPASLPPGALPAPGAKAPEGPKTVAACPRCRWDKDAAFAIVIADDDKRAFVNSLVSGTPFSRAYPIFGGALEVVFRDLTPDESDAVAKAASDEVQPWGVNPQTDPMLFASRVEETMSRSADSRAVLALVAVSVRDKGVVWVAPEKVPGETAVERLAKAREAVRSSPVGTESVWRAARTAYADHVNMLDLLVARAHLPNF